jgi:hypothetical protein
MGRVEGLVRYEVQLVWLMRGHGKRRVPRFYRWAFLDTYRTLCVVPNAEVREIFEQIRNGNALYMDNQ